MSERVPSSAESVAGLMASSQGIGVTSIRKFRNQKSNLNENLAPPLVFLPSTKGQQSSLSLLTSIDPRLAPCDGSPTASSTNFIFNELISTTSATTTSITDNNESLTGSAVDQLLVISCAFEPHEHVPLPSPPSVVLASLKLESPTVKSPRKIATRQQSQQQQVLVPDISSTIHSSMGKNHTIPYIISPSAPSAPLSSSSPCTLPLRSPPLSPAKKTPQRRIGTPKTNYPPLITNFLPAFEGKQIVKDEDLENVMHWSMMVAPELFWSKFPRRGKPKPDDWKCFDLVFRVVVTVVKAYLSKLKSIGIGKNLVKYRDKDFDAFKFLNEHLTGQLLCSSKREEADPTIVDEIFETFYICGFQAMLSVKEPKKLASGNCEICNNRNCSCFKIVQIFKDANFALKNLGLMEELVGPKVYDVLRKQIIFRVSLTNTGKYEYGHLEDLLKWLEVKMLPWIEIIYPDRESLKMPKLKKEFSNLLYDLYGKSIIDNLFSVIVEYPDSKPCLDDLRICLRYVNLRRKLVIKLKSALERRLLNAGVNTVDVLEAYISTVRALKYVDPSGILVQLVTPPVREYLKQREETVRVILVSLTEESGDLAEELAKNPVYTERKGKSIGNNWKEWEPDPIDVPKDKQNLRKSDLIQAMISIYGSKTLFIDEYRTLLADRLLKMPKPSPLNHEIRCLELLKLRFGEVDLQKCEVMLKDVSDSQRLNVRFYEEEGAVLAKQEVQVTGLLVSAQFWPTFKPEKLEVPPVINQALEKYTKAFEAIKGNRTLEWQKHIGTVELELDIDGNLHNFTVNPSQATIISQFGDGNDEWTLENLSKETGMSVALIRSRITFWVSKGILLESSPDVYRISQGTGGERHDRAGVSKFVEDLDMDGAYNISTSTQKENELQMFWSYIEGMLTNLDSLPLSRIHSMLKLFATVECTVEELQKFLDAKVTQGALTYSAGQYQLPK